MSQIAIAALIAVNLGLIFLALAAPLGIRTVRSAVVANAPRERASPAPSVRGAARPGRR